MNEQVEEILQFWFPEASDAADPDQPTGPELWFVRSVEVDREIKRRFGKLVERARAGALEPWASSARGRLALILLLDEFPRHIHGERPEAYASDAQALQLSYDGLDEDMDKDLDIPLRAWFYMPAMHAEDADAQLASVELFSELLDTAPPAYRTLCEALLRRAERHREVVERFDRFPHRNHILDRASTPEESAFLQTSGDELL
ncbi:MAG: DUF924 family protein [Sandaracinaceae bacterium]